MRNTGMYFQIKIIKQKCPLMRKLDTFSINSFSIVRVSSIFWLNMDGLIPSEKDIKEFILAPTSSSPTKSNDINSSIIRNYKDLRIKFQIESNENGTKKWVFEAQ